MSNSKPEIFVFSGPSGSGKTTIVRALLDKYSQLAFSVSATTRNIRQGETDGKDYYFISAPEFREKIKDGKFIEYEEVYPGIFYGTLLSEIDRIIASGKYPILDIDVYGAVKIKHLYGHRALLVFVHPGSIEILKQRLIKRKTETPEKMDVRLNKALEELGMASSFDITLFNDSSPENAIVEAFNLIENNIL